MLGIKVDSTISCDCDKCHYILKIKCPNDDNIANALNKNFYFFKQEKKAYHRTLCKYHSITKEGIAISYESIFRIVKKLKGVIT